MNTQIQAILFLAVGTVIASAQTARYVTITASATNSTVVSNQVSIAEAETAEVNFFGPASGSETASLEIIKDGITFPKYLNNQLSTAFPDGLHPVVRGPAQFALKAYSAGKAMLTLKVTPEGFDPNRPLILPPATNQVYVTLESSTNLANWADATNGVYGSPDTARFFRIRMDRLN